MTDKNLNTETVPHEGSSPSVAAESHPREGQEWIASFPDYVQAQALVDRMSDDGFPVQHVRIVGDGVRTVEQVTGRMTLGKAAVGGAATGAWFGLLVGLLFGLFAIDPVSWLAVLLISLTVGAVWGVIFGIIAHGVTRANATSPAS